MYCLIMSKCKQSHISMLDKKQFYAIDSFKSEDGISRQETGTVKEVIDAENKPQKVIVVRGSYTYYTEEGKPVTITYYADETGFHAEGEVIPKAPAARI